MSEQELNARIQTLLQRRVSAVFGNGASTKRVTKDGCHVSYKIFTDDDRYTLRGEAIQ